MKKKPIAKKTSFLVLFVLFLCLIAWVGVFMSEGSKVDLTSRAADVVEYDAYALDVTGWTPKTYRNAPDFDLNATVSLSGTPYAAIGYGLDSTASEQYSMEASLTSSYLNVPPNQYLLRFFYYTRMREETPHEVTLYAGNDPDDLRYVATVFCARTEERFTEEIISISDSFRYLRLEIKTFYSKDSDDDTTDRSLYFLSSGFELLAQKEDVFAASYFTIESDSTAFVYNGLPQMPTVSLSSTIFSENEFAFTVYPYLATDRTRVSDSVHAGNYVLEIEVRNRSNAVCFVSEIEYVITRTDLTVKSIEYICNANYIVILDVELTDRLGRKITAEEAELSYFTSTMNGRSYDSLSPVMPNPGETFNVGVQTGSPDFYTLTENNFLLVEDRISGNKIFSFDKHASAVYCGKPIDPFKNVFFIESGTPVEAPEYRATYYLVDGGETEVAQMKDVGEYRIHLQYETFEWDCYFTVTPRPIAAYLYAGGDLVKNYDGTDDLFDKDADAVVTKLPEASLVCIDDPAYPGADGVLRNAEISDIVTLSYEKASFGRAIGNTYIVLENPTLSGTDAPNYFLTDNFRVIGGNIADDNTFTVASNVYTPTTGRYLRDDLTYSRAYFTEAAVEAGESVPSGYFYFDGTSYRPYLEETFGTDVYYTVVASVNKAVRIERTDLILRSDRDELGNVITCPDKTYTPGDRVADSVAASLLNVLLPCYGNDSPITYKSVTFMFADCTVGTHRLSVILSDQSLYDRFAEEVLTPVPLYGTIVPCVLQADADRADEFIENTDKVYDGTNVAFPRFTDFILEDAPIDFPAPSDYRLSYQRAEYGQTNKGENVSLTITGITLTGLTLEAENFLRNYSFAPIETVGSILPATLVVYSQTLRIFEGQTPNVQTNAESSIDVRSRIYVDELSAAAGGTSIPFSATREGKYWLRVDSLSENYVLPEPGYVLVPISVITTEKVRQKLLFTGGDLSGGKDFTILLGSVFSFSAYSVEEDTGRATGLSVSCVLSDPDGILSVDDAICRAERTGTFTLTATQSGNNYYYEADPVTLRFTVVAQSVTMESDPELAGLYGGAELPELTPGSYVLSYRGATPSGNLTPSDETLTPSTTPAPYTYYFVSDPTLGSTTADFSTGDASYYVVTGEKYVQAEEYDPYFSYYRPVYREETVTPGESLDRTYYENVFIRTQDTVFDGGKNYYEASYIVASVQADEVVPVNTYYEKNEGYYSPSEDTYFYAGKVYYTAEYRAEATTANAPVPQGVYYELTQGAYVLTSDATFDGEKTYYVLVYEEATVIYGDLLGTETVYYNRTADVWFLTEDTAFDGDKTYYVIAYVLASVETDASVEGVYYECDRDLFRISYDDTFLTGKTYYRVEYTPVFFINAGDRIDETLYLERSDESTLLEVTAGDVFRSDKTYVRIVWTEKTVNVGDPVESDVYEKAETSYVPTNDDYFIRNKTYYLPLYTAASVTGGDPVTGDYFEYDPEKRSYFATEDTVFGEKTYYTLAYVVAAVQPNAERKGRVYYEKADDEFFLTSDTNYISGKTYYATAPHETVFLTNNVGEFYRIAPVMTLSSDPLFRRDVLYYTVSYEEADVEGGTPLTDAYFTLEGGVYRLSTERFFDYEKTYYRAVYTAIDTLQERKIDAFDHFYVRAEGVYLDGVDYYVFDKGWVLDDAVSVGETVDAAHYTLVRDDEFRQGTTYYHIVYAFVGSAPVTVRLTAQKPVVTVYTVVYSSSSYGEESDLTSLVEKITLNRGNGEELLSEQERQAFLADLDFALYFASAGGEIESLAVADLEPGVYGFENNRRESYADDTAFLEMTARAQTDLYRFVLAEGSTVHTVEKASFTVQLPIVDKFYGQSVPSEESLLDLIECDGPTDVLPDLKNNLKITVQAGSYSDTGEYPVRISVRHLLAVGVPVPEDTYYEKNEGVYSLTGDERFVANKTYYVSIYREAEVTVGEAIDLQTYYVLTNDTYIRPSESTFEEGKTYYVKDFAAAEISDSATFEDLSALYDIRFLHGFIKVDPITIRVGATTPGHDYGNNIAEVTPTVTVVSDAVLTKEELDELCKEILGDVVIHHSVTPQSDSGDYPIYIAYNGNSKNCTVLVADDCVYSVHYALLNPDPTAPSFIFRDASVLYDGALHNIKVSYNTSLWDGVTITYDKESFSEVGNYLYTATISKKNYYDLTLTATLSICDLTVRSSNRNSNAVTVTITDPTCVNGVNGDYTVVLRAVTDETALEEVAKLIVEEKGVKKEIEKVYTVFTYLDSTETSFGYASYTVSVKPMNLPYSENIAVYGYSAGVFTKLDYTYLNGEYTFNVSADINAAEPVDPLSYIVFVEETTTEAEVVQYKWVFIVLIALAVLLLIGVVLSAGKRASRAQRASKRRHNRYI